MPARPAPRQLDLALTLAGYGWHILPLSPTSKRPLANCPACREVRGRPAHRIEDCPCLPGGGWCHGVRAATTDTARITSWWTRNPAAIPGVAAGPSGLVLVDIDHHHEQLPPSLATGLLPGIDLTREPLPAEAWSDPGRFRDGHDTLNLLARLRAGPAAWPKTLKHAPVVTATPSGGHHLWYRAPAGNLHQVLADPQGRYGLAWQVDIKAGWSYGIAPGAGVATGVYRPTTGHPAHVGRMPTWLAIEVIRVAGPTLPGPMASAPRLHITDSRGKSASAAYLRTVLDRGTRQLTRMTDGRQRALSALAYQAGGLLAASGLEQADVTDQLVAAGLDSGLPQRIAERTVCRALANGRRSPILPRSRGAR